MELPINVRDEYRNLQGDKIKKIQESLTSNLRVLLFNIRTDGNIGMIIRQSCIMGCKEVIICGRKQYDKRFTVGAHNYITVGYWDTPLKVNIHTVSPGVYKENIEYNPEEFIYKCGNSTPIFLEQGGKDIREVSWKLVENPLLILGNESLGIPHAFIKAVKDKIPNTLVISIPQQSVMRSMNVAIAGSIALWEISKELI